MKINITKKCVKNIPTNHTSIEIVENNINVGVITEKKILVNVPSGRQGIQGPQGPQGKPGSSVMYSFFV